MKLKNILFVFVMIIISSFVTNVKALGNAPDSFAVNADDIEMLYGSEYLGHGSTLNFSYKKNANGDIIYCTEIHDSMVTSGSEVYTLNKEMDAKFAYILSNGYPNKSITGNNNKDYYITGLAIWYLIAPDDTAFYNFNLDKGTYKGYDSEVVKEVAKLVNGSKNYSYTNPALNINEFDNNLILSSDGKYYVSNSISVTASGNVSKYTVSLDGAPSGTIIVNSDGNEKNTFGVNESFLVKVPVESIDKLSDEFNVNVTADGYINKAYLYSPTNSKHQSTTVLYSEKKALNDSAILKYNLTTEVLISKTDATTSEELPGATLMLKDANGNEIETWVSDGTPHVIRNLPVGKYYLTEIIAPEGYVLSTETVEFEITANGVAAKVVMKNYPEEKKNPIYISKQDITTGEELPGARLEIKDESGNVIEAWISGLEKHVIEEGLEPGKYYLTEVIAPEGYELSTETIEFIVKEDGTVDGDIIMYNKPETIIEVPSTSSFKTITASLIGIIVIGLGFMMIYRNYKKNEEY